MGWVCTSWGVPGGQRGEGMSGMGPICLDKKGFKSGDKGAFSVQGTSWGSGANPAVTAETAEFAQFWLAQ